MPAYSAEALLECHGKIEPYIHRTPVMTSRLLNSISGASLFFKCENFQRGGSYKLRGATHAVLLKKEDGPLSGVVTHSSGNFAQALSLAAQELDIPAYIVMPENAPEVKKQAVKQYGGIVYECEATLEAREFEAERIRKETGAIFIHPSNDPQVMLGQGTAALELLQDVNGLDLVIAPVGGGGLLGGTAIATSSHAAACIPLGAEPLAVDDAYRSLKAGKILGNKTTETIADGLKTVLGSHTFPVIQKHVKTIIRVEESEIKRAMHLIWERMKIVVEPSSAVTLAAVLKEPQYFKGRRTGLIISGGNVDLSRLPF